MYCFHRMTDLVGVSQLLLNFATAKRRGESQGNLVQNSNPADGFRGSRQSDLCMCSKETQEDEKFSLDRQDRTPNGLYE